MSDADRKRLVAILGMLGSASAGERDNAARLAEQFRRQHGLTWAQLFEPQMVYVEREVFVERPAPPPEPEPPPVWPDHPPYQPPPAVGPDWKAAGIAAAIGASVSWRRWQRAPSTPDAAGTAQAEPPTVNLREVLGRRDQTR